MSFEEAEEYIKWRKMRMGIDSGSLSPAPSITHGSIKKLKKIRFRSLSG
jgi:hypothetical protein